MRKTEKTKNIEDLNKRLLKEGSLNEYSTTPVNPGWYQIMDAMTDSKKNIFINLSTPMSQEEIGRGIGLEGDKWMYIKPTPVPDHYIPQIHYL